MIDRSLFCLLMGCCTSRSVEFPAAASGRVSPEKVSVPSSLPSRVSHLKTRLTTNMGGYAISDSTGSLIEPDRNCSENAGMVLALVPPEGISIPSSVHSSKSSSQNNSRTNFYVTNTTSSKTSAVDVHRRSRSVRGIPAKISIPDSFTLSIDELSRKGSLTLPPVQGSMGVSRRLTEGSHYSNTSKPITYNIPETIEEHQNSDDITHHQNNTGRISAYRSRSRTTTQRTKSDTPTADVPIHIFTSDERPCPLAAEVLRRSSAQFKKTSKSRQSSLDDTKERDTDLKRSSVKLSSSLALEERRNTNPDFSIYLTDTHDSVLMRSSGSVVISSELVINLQTPSKLCLE